MRVWAPISRNSFSILAGRTMLQRSVDAFDSHPRISECVVVLPDDTGGSGAISGTHRWLVTKGGPRRQDSVQNGLKELSSKVDLVLILTPRVPL
jgi:2-C-methyl-D-erythritol 4-phosphate cytidylyltransferase